MRALRFDGARMIADSSLASVPLANDAARLLDRLRAEPLPEDERPATALRKATQAAFALLEEVRKLTADGAPAGGAAPQPRPALPAPGNAGGGRDFFDRWSPPAPSAADRRRIERQKKREDAEREIAAARCRG